MSEHANGGGSGKLAILGISVILIAYVLAAVMGVPQKGTEMIKAALSHGTHAEAVEETPATPVPTTEGTAPAEQPAAETTPVAEPVAEEAAHEAHEAGHEAHAEQPLPPLVMVLPFALLLLAIALLPLIPATEHWWESNLHRFYVAAILGVITLIYYGFAYPGMVDCHWPAHSVSDGSAWSNMSCVFINAIFDEFIPFIVLLFALFTIAGGIRIEGDLKASPLTNTTILAIGAALASFVGTTGAAMLLIRLLLETNKERKFKVHTIVFFIFAVCNCGGCLLPTGDPPLFLGYLKGVSFLWTMHLWKEWLFTNAILLVVYFLWDTMAYRKEHLSDLVKDATQIKPLSIQGWFPNVFLLVGVILAVALLDPKKAVPGTDWHAWLYLREVIQLLMVWLSLTLGRMSVRVANRFSYNAIIEVAALFFGIFICMQVPLQILNAKGDQLGLTRTDTHAFYWSTGVLSSVLDNAPTYVVFSTTAEKITQSDAKAGHIIPYPFGTEPPKDCGEIKAVPTEAGIDTALLTAVSLGAVFMGAMTYIGNGPNFMVKAIAEEEGVKMPSFFGYMAYSVCILLPIFFVMTILFL
ncbi:MAG: sodium:proton antiporter [Planctomycetia bacterium]|nr:sodium:proton antiporter [Planctomycetia bacterium]